MPEERAFSEVLVADIMTEGVEVVKKSMLISQVAHLMLRERVSGYPVVNDDGSIAGIVTLTDLFILLDKISDEVERDKAEGKKVQFHDKIIEYKERAVSEIMSSDVFSISPNIPVSEVVSLAAKKNIHTFPVVEKGMLVGIIGRHDILNAAFLYA
ncbi:MAG: CBS domain-containing protein [Candidatus Omnitrophica bacterium]|nr:CBS domain-containing protein [Candidatus Omnitrophota bacterium]MBU4334115.1 CBS domain-containing protein [Candidatus Omnitrophota bacterium]